MSHERLNWERMLAARGHRVTPQRVLVLDAVCEAEGHSTTLGEISARVRKQDAGVDRSTVYRALHLFTQLGLVVQTVGADGEARFELVDTEPHHHLVCQACGAEQLIESPEITGALQAIQDRFGFRVAAEHLTLNGLCAACQRLSDER
jgi:Fur family ferric uptake transcriptional regulator